MAKAEIGGYRIDGTLGEGGMGHVYRARDVTLERDIALKVIRADSLTAIGKERFLREARACSRISHPNIITVYAAGEDDGHPYMAMELIAGRTLREIIDEGPVPWRQAIRWIADIADALCRLHQEGIIHRDLKPENIMVKEDGLVKLMDFGIAHMASSATLTREGVSLGTVFYMSPEQASGKKADARSDIFSLAAVLYEMLTGQFAFKGEHPMAVMYSITNASPPAIDGFGIEFPENLKEIVERALEKDPEDRFDDAGQLRDGLEKLLGGTRGGPQPGVLMRLVLPAVVAITVGVIVWAVFMRGGPDREAATRHNEKGLAFEEAGEVVKARDQYLEAIDEDPDYVRPYNNLGMLYLRQGDSTQAVVQFDKALMLGSDIKLDVSVLYNLADLRLAMQDSTRAYLYFMRAIDEDPSFLYAYNNLGALHIGSNRIEEAKAILDDALGKTTSPHYTEVAPYLLKNRGKVAARFGRQDEAFDYWTRAVAVMQDNVELHLLLAAWHERDGTLEKAREHWARVVELTNGEQQRQAQAALERIGSK